MSAIKIVVRNSTVWQTRMLLPFIRRIAREEFDGSTPKRTRSRLTVEIVYNRSGKYGGGYCTGYGFYNSSLSRVRVPFPHKGVAFPVLDFCHVLGHEFAHNRGLKHEEMGWHYGNSCRRGSYTNPHYGWAKALPVPLVKAKPRRPSLDEKRAKELTAAKAAVERWERKLALSKTKLKLWTRRVRVLEKRIAAGVDTAPAEALPSAACGTIDAAAPSQVTGERDASD